MNRLIISCLFGTLLLTGCENKDNGAKGGDAGPADSTLQKEVQAYLDNYTDTFQQLMIQSSLAQWKLNTMILPDDTLTPYEAEMASEAMAAFTGSKENIEKSRKYLQRKDALTPLQVKQLEVILYSAGSSPQIVSETVKQLIKADTRQTRDLYGFNFEINGDTVSTNYIDSVLSNSQDLEERKKAWQVSKEVGKVLKDGLAQLRDLRNKTVQALDYPNYFDYQVSEYGMDAAEMLELNDQFIAEIWPLYRELHTWARYELAERYDQPVPQMLPATWLPNRWGQDWIAMVDVEGLDINAALKNKTPEWIVKKGEEFYISLGFDPLPRSFYDKSSLYPLPPNTSYKKNNHASAWHMDNNKDVRSLMSVTNNAEWWETVLHELGHIYYYLSYSTPEVPLLLREGANRAYHEAIGSLIGLASMQKPFLEEMGLAEKGVELSEDQKMQKLLQESLNYVVLIPWASGVMTHFEHDLYSKNLPEDQFNKQWWELKKKFQGIVPPAPRGEEYCDACSKTHINNDAAQYYDYALSYVMLLQMHVYIADHILHQDPHSTNYYGNKKIGTFLKDLMAPGATVDWREHYRQVLGSDMSAEAMVDYFRPLLDYLKKENKGRVYSLPLAPPV